MEAGYEASFSPLPYPSPSKETLVVFLWICTFVCVCVCVHACVQGWSKPDVVRNVALPLEGKGGDCALTPSAGASPRLSCEELRSRGQEAWAPSCFKPGQVT